MAEKRKYVLGIDCGTRGVKCGLFDFSGGRQSFGFSPFFNLQKEFSALMWWNGLLNAVSYCLKKAKEKNIDFSEIAALGICDDFVSVKMIKLVNFGRQILGSSRSRKEDCKTALKLMKNKKNQKLLAKSLNPKKFYIKKAADLKTAFSSFF